MTTESVPHGGMAWFGRAALLGAVAVLVLEIVAIALGNARHWELATVLAWVVIGLTVVTFVAGVGAAVLGRGRRAGVIAAVLSVLVNPLVQIAVLGLVGNS